MHRKVGKWLRIQSCERSIVGKICKYSRFRARNERARELWTMRMVSLWKEMKSHGKEDQSLR